MQLEDINTKYETLFNKIDILTPRNTFKDKFEQLEQLEQLDKKEEKRQSVLILSKDHSSLEDQTEKDHSPVKEESNLMINK